MSLGKKDITKNISSKAQISTKVSKEFLESFISLIIKNSQTKDVKLAKFGTFSSHRTPERIGRNPKTKEEFVIQERTKIILKPSPKLKTLIN